jgi:hypothetical protein
MLLTFEFMLPTRRETCLRSILSFTYLLVINRNKANDFPPNIDLSRLADQCIVRWSLAILVYPSSSSGPKNLKGTPAICVWIIRRVGTQTCSHCKGKSNVYAAALCDHPLFVRLSLPIPVLLQIEFSCQSLTWALVNKHLVTAIISTLPRIFRGTVSPSNLLALSRSQKIQNWYAAQAR